MQSFNNTQYPNGIEERYPINQTSQLDDAKILSIEERYPIKQTSQLDAAETISIEEIYPINQTSQLHTAEALSVEERYPLNQTHQGEEFETTVTPQNCRPVLGYGVLEGLDGTSQDILIRNQGTFGMLPDIHSAPKRAISTSQFLLRTPDNGASKEALSLIDSGASDKRDKNNIKLLKCSDCKTEFKRKTDLERHQRSKHGGEPIYFCNHHNCKRSRIGFKRSDHLAQHLTGVHKDGPVREVEYVNQNVAPSSPKGNTVEAPGLAKKRKRDCYLSKDELLEELQQERAKRIELEQELHSVRKKHEERMDILYSMFQDNLRRREA